MPALYRYINTISTSPERNEYLLATLKMAFTACYHLNQAEAQPVDQASGTMGKVEWASQQGAYGAMYDVMREAFYMIMDDQGFDIVDSGASQCFDAYFDTCMDYGHARDFHPWLKQYLTW